MKKHPVELRDRDEDMKKLADSFFEHLSLVSSKKSDHEMWGIDPRYPLGGRDSDLAQNILLAINYFDDKETCEHCGSELEENAMDDRALEYALELWSELGLWLERRWHDLHEATEPTADDLCVECGCEVEAPVGEDGPFVCEDCDEGEEDEDDSEDDPDSAEDLCGECGDEVGSCDCEEDPEEEEEDEDLEEACSIHGTLLYDDGSCIDCDEEDEEDEAN